MKNLLLNKKSLIYLKYLIQVKIEVEEVEIKKIKKVKKIEKKRKIKNKKRKRVKRIKIKMNMIVYLNMKYIQSNNFNKQKKDLIKLS